MTLTFDLSKIVIWPNYPANHALENINDELKMELNSLKGFIISIIVNNITVVQKEELIWKKNSMFQSLPQLSRA